MEKKQDEQQTRTFAVRAFRDDIIGAIFCRCNLEIWRAWLLTGRERWSKTLCRQPHIQAPPCPIPHCLPGSPLTRLENSRGRKDRNAPSKYCPDLWGLQSPYSNRDSTLSTWEKKSDRGWNAGVMELGPLLHHHFAQFKPCDIFPSSPYRPSTTSTCPHPVPGAQAQMPAPQHKRNVFTFKAGCCPLRICPRKGSTRDCTPCPEPLQDRRQPLAGDISKYEPGTGSQVPRPPRPWDTQPGFLSLQGGRGLGTGGIRRQPAETAGGRKHCLNPSLVFQPH